MKPTIEFAGMTIEILYRYCVTVTHYNGDPIPNGAVKVYTLPDGSVNRDVYGPFYRHMKFGALRELVRTVPPEMILDLYKRHYEWDAAQDKIAGDACGPIMTKAITAAKVAYTTYRAAVAGIRDEYGLEYIDIARIKI